jgi:hypothetical protein
LFLFIFLFFTGSSIQRIRFETILRITIVSFTWI